MAAIGRARRVGRRVRAGLANRLVFAAACTQVFDAVGNEGLGLPEWNGTLELEGQVRKREEG